MKSEDAVHLHNYLHFFAISILYYDHLCTFPLEVSRIWLRPFNSGSWLFITNRYLNFFADIAVTKALLTTMPEKSCRSYAAFRQWLLVAAQVIVCIVLTVRTFALYNRSLKVLAAILTFAFILLAIACWAVLGAHTHADIYKGSGCHLITPPAGAWRLAMAWEALFALDTFIFGLTLARTWRFTSARGYIRRPARVGDATTAAAAISSRGLDLVAILMRDGATYYAIMALANLANLITFYALEPLLKGVLSTFASTISVTMCSRLILNLHDSARHGGSPSTDITANTGTSARSTDPVLTSAWEASTRPAIVELDEHEMSHHASPRVQIGIEGTAENGVNAHDLQSSLPQEV